MLTEAGQSSTAGQQTKRELDAEKDPKVDRNVFGIPLGDAMRLPRCPQGKLPATHATCYLPDGAGSMLQIFFASADGTSPPGTRKVAVVLGPDRCPDWVSGCAAALVLKDEFIVAAQFRAAERGDDRYVQDKLTAKYGSPKITPLAPLDCSTSRNSFDGRVVVEHHARDAQLRRWDRLGMTVVYSQTCAGSVAEVRTGVYQRLLQRLEASQPQL